jgi:hypothetical protein
MSFRGGSLDLLAVPLILQLPTQHRQVVPDLQLLIVVESHLLACRWILERWQLRHADEQFDQFVMYLGILAGEEDGRRPRQTESWMAIVQRSRRSWGEGDGC